MPMHLEFESDPALKKFFTKGPSENAIIHFAKRVAYTWKLYFGEKRPSEITPCSTHTVGGEDQPGFLDWTKHIRKALQTKS